MQQSKMKKSTNYKIPKIQKNCVKLCHVSLKILRRITIPFLVNRISMHKLSISHFVTSNNKLQFLNFPIFATVAFSRFVWFCFGYKIRHWNTIKIPLWIYHKTYIFLLSYFQKSLASSIYLFFSNNNQQSALW